MKLFSPPELAIDHEVEVFLRFSFESCRINMRQKNEHSASNISGIIVIYYIL